MKRLITLNSMLMLTLVACSSTVSGTVPPISATMLPSIVPTNMPMPVSEPKNPSTQASQFKSFPRANCCKARAVEEGDYDLPAWLDLPLTIDVGEGWSVLNEEKARLFLFAGKGRNEFNDPSQVLVFIVIPDADPQEILNTIRNSPELIPDDIVETTIARFSGWQFDATAKPNPGYEGDRNADIPPGVQFLPAINQYFTPGFLWTTWTAEPRLRFVVLNAGEQMLLLEIESPPAEFDAFAREAEQVLQTLKLPK